jgi:hypothetical protein
MTEAKKFARELFTACRELARDESTVSMSYIIVLRFMFPEKNRTWRTDLAEPIQHPSLGRDVMPPERSPDNADQQLLEQLPRRLQSASVLSDGREDRDADGAKPNESVHGDVEHRAFVRIREGG